MIAPVARGSSSGDCNSTLLLLYHPIHRSSPIMDFSDPMDPTGIEEDTLGGSGFSCVNVCHYPDIPDLFKRKSFSHLISPPSFGKL